MADEAKAKGNAAFSAKNYPEAISHFSDAIALSPDNHVLYSNRSAAYASLGNFTDALTDAKKTVSLNPSWPKGYSRLGAAYLGLRDLSAAVDAYKKGLDFDPNNDALKTGLADAERARRPAPGASPFGDAFAGPEMWAKLTADPSTRPYLQQEDYVRMMQEIQKNPSNLNMYLQDQRVMKSLGVLLNIKMRTAGDDGDFNMADVGDDVAEKEEEKEAVKETVKEKVVVEEEVMAEDGNKVVAKKEKEKGNVAYKKKEFETAIECYSKAIELDDEDISYLTNRAAVYLEMGKVLFHNTF